MDCAYFADGLPDLMESGIEFSPEVIAAALGNIYRRTFDIKRELEPNFFAATSELFEQSIAEGMADAAQDGTPWPDEAFLRALKQSADVFSAFRTHRMQNDIARQLLNEDGELKSFSRFARDVQPYIDHRNRAWLRTEYNTAVQRAHLAARWQQFEAERDVLPNLRWEESTSPNPGADHRVFWGTVRPIDDPFWSEHRPGDRWNCKCSLEATDEPANAVPSDIPPGDHPAPGLDNNPGRDGVLINDHHPYFPHSCAACPLAKNKLSALFAGLKAGGRKDCENCELLARIIEATRNSAETSERPPHFDEYREVARNVYASPWHGENELKDNMRAAKFISGKVHDKVWLLPRLDPKNPTQALLRDTLLPHGVPTGKNADFLIQGKTFEGKSLLGLTDFNREHVKQMLENRIKKAKKQADNIILEVPSMVKREVINATVLNYLSRSDKQREVWVIWKNKLLRYKKSVR